MADLDQSAMQRPRFPVLDLEPPPRPWWWHTLVSVGALAAAGGVAAAVAFWPFSPGTLHSGRAAGSAQSAGLPGGRIVAVDGTGSLVLSSPEGGGVTRPSALRNIGQPVSPSPDNNYLSLPNGELVAVHQGPALAYLATKVANDGSTIAAWPDPFANHDRDEIMLRAYAGYESADNPVFVVSLATGRSVPLGTADRVAGDPQTDGAFVSVAATTPSPSASATLTTADVRLELRQPARPGTVLATSVSLRADVGLGSSLPVALWPYPDPSGRTIAVVVAPVSGSQAGIVVLSRSGRELGSISASAGIRGFPAWSPSGGSLAFVGTVSSGAELHVWTMGGRSSAWKLPPGHGDDQCVWSPSGSAVICASLAVADSQNWTAVRVAAGAAGRPVAVNGPGLPVAWLAASGAR